VAELRGSKTEQNLLAAFAGESQARNKYTYFASAARKEGYEQIAAIFLETADQEKTQLIRRWGLTCRGASCHTAFLDRSTAVVARSLLCFLS
jgi:hypothetical protein